MEQNHNEILLSAFANVLRRRRHAAGLSQEKLAQLSGKSMRYISLLESRRHQPTLETLHSIANSLNVSLSQLMLETEKEVKALSLKGD